MKKTNYEWYDSINNKMLYGDEAYKCITDELKIIVNKKEKLLNTIDEIMKLIREADDSKDDCYEYLLELGEAISISEILMKSYVEANGDEI